MNNYKTHVVRARLDKARIAKRGYTLVEILVATTLTLIMMFAVVQIFAMISGNVSDSRAILEMNDRLRAAKTLLQRDLEGLTVVPAPPLGEAADGYLEIIEGPVMAPPSGGTLPSAVAVNTIDGPTPVPDTTVGDFDDVLLFTSSTWRASLEGGNALQPEVAEIVWFVHGNRLYRHVQRVVEPPVVVDPPELRSGGLAHRANRNRKTPNLRAVNFPFAVTPPNSVVPRDFWTQAANDSTLVPAGSFENLIQPDNVILTNVIGFDVKVFDPGAPIRDANGNIVGFGDYVDLGYTYADYDPDIHPVPHFTDSGAGNVFDTWSTDYLVDDSDPDSGYRPPPYPAPLRGIQVRIRVFEPDSRMIREVTVVQDFLPR